jgi:hypothetical protein
MATVTEYRGDAGLGVGSNADIPVTTNKDLDLINQTARDIYINNTSRNQQLFQQKLADRDKLLAAIDSGDIKTGDLLDQDMPLVKEGLEKLDQAFENRVKKGINDLDAAREYKKALRDAQDRVTQAQGRKLFYDAESGEIGKETLPRKQEARKKNLDSVIGGGFWKDIQPYQQTQDLDINGSILSTAANITEQFQDPKNPLLKGKRTMFDYDKTLDSNVDNFLNDANKRYDQQQLMGSIQSLDPQTFVKHLQAINSRIKEYNTLKGVGPGNPGYVEDVKFEVNPQTGQPMINEKAPDFAAKYTLSRQKPFGASETVFDDKMGAYLVNKQKADTDAFYKRAMAAAAGTKARAYSENVKQQMALRKGQQEKDEFLDELWTRNFTNQKSLIESKGENKFYLKDIKADESLPIYTIENGAAKQLIAIGAKPVYDKDEKKILYYEGGHFEPQYMMNDKQIPAQDITGIYENMKRQQGSNWKGGFDDFLKMAVKNGKLRVTLKGVNGTSDEELSRAAQQLISNKGSKKGQTGVFDNNDDVPQDEQISDNQ